MFSAAFSSAAENGPQNSSSTSLYWCFPVSMSSSSSSKWLVNCRSMMSGKCATRRSKSRAISATVGTSEWGCCGPANSCKPPLQ